MKRMATLDGSKVDLVARDKTSDLAYYIYTATKTAD